MTRIKHIILIVTMLLTLGLTAEAQSTALRPFEGASHSYTWNGLAAGLNYEFYLTTDASGAVVYDDSSTGEFDFLNTPSGSISTGESSASVQISWNTGAALNVYCVWLEVTIPGGCSNKRYVEVRPQTSAFDLLSENIPVANTVSCPATTASDGFVASSSAYSAGFTTLEFKVKRFNGTNNPLTASTTDTYDWSFVPSLTVNPDLSLGKVIISIIGSTSGTIAPVAGRYSVNGHDDEVTVSVSIENAPGYTRNVTFKVTEQLEENTNLLDNDPTNDGVTHTIEVMPIIDSMGGV